MEKITLRVYPETFQANGLGLRGCRLQFFSIVIFEREGEDDREKEEALWHELRQREFRLTVGGLDDEVLMLEMEDNKELLETQRAEITKLKQRVAQLEYDLRAAGRHFW